MVTIGKIFATHGVRGEVKVKSYSDVPGRFERLRRVVVEGPTGGRTLTVSRSRRTAKGYLLEFETIESLEAAKLLVGSVLQIPEERLAAPSDDRYYEYQLVGMEVQTEDGVYVGCLREIWPTPGNPVFLVEGPTGVEHLIPATKEIVQTVDLDRQRMVVRAVPGLLGEDHAL